MSNNDELKDVLEQLENEEMTHKSEQNVDEKTKKTNADYLEKMAYINVILFILGAMYLIVNSFENQINWIGLATGIAILIIGFTLFFLLKTIIDIYKKVK